MIIINTKNYKTSDELIRLARLVESYKVKAAIAVPSIDLDSLKEKTKLQVYAQHVEPIESKKSTGFLSAESLYLHGITGSLLNHSEHPMALEDIRLAVKQLRNYKLISIVCANSISQVKQIMSFRPSAIAFEDPKLISTGKSITKYNLRDLHSFINLLKGKKIIPICGAGISSIEDIKSASAMGCPSVLIASAIASAKDPSSLLKDISNWQKGK